MPTYQYACTDCGEQLEVVQKFTDDALTVCPACDGRLRKVFSAVGVVFKGSGFYRTDSRNGSNGSSNGSAKTSSEGSGDTPAAANDSAGKGTAGKGTSGSGTSSRSTANEATAAA